MDAFGFSTGPLEPQRYRAGLADPGAGGYASFEGWVRDHNEGRRVRRLEYEAYEALARKEGARIVAAAIEKFGVHRAACVHRVGALDIGELAVWVGASAAHREEAFAACRYIIDEVKHRVPIWKKEHYEDGDSGWVNCERCAELPGAREHAHGHGPAHHHAHDHFVHDYSRQIALPEVGEAGQARLRASSVLVIGAGGLGVPVLQYLAAAGVGRLTIADGDLIEASNLHRQPIYEAEGVGRPKALVAAERLRRMNRDLDCEAVTEHVSAASIDALVGAHDLVIECTDNLRAKFLVNDAVVRAGRPAVFASVHQYEGQLQVYRPEPDWPCLRCLWPEAPRDGLVGNCAEAGVLGPVPGAIGTLQAMQALQLLLGLDTAPPGLVIVDLPGLATRHIGARRDPDCDHGPSGHVATQESGSLEIVVASLEEARAAGFELVDIREAWERQVDAGCGIPLHLPLSELLGGRVDFPVAGRHLIVCAHGVRSLALAEHLRERGRSGVYSLRGGIAALRA
jgi:adenylyltransferase/sulfurtransferase